MPDIDVGKVAVPDLSVAPDFTSALVLLDAVDLIGVQVGRASALAVGSVVDQSPAATTQVDPLSTVTVYTSLGLVAVLQTLFLADGVPVPAGSVFYRGEAYDRVTGSLYVCPYPANGAVVFVRGIAHRYDGAMCVAVGGAAAALVAAVAITALGEVIAAVAEPDVVQNGLPLQQDGTLCVSNLA